MSATKFPECHHLFFQQTFLSLHHLNMERVVVLGIGIVVLLALAVAVYYALKTPSTVKTSSISTIPGVPTSIPTSGAPSDDPAAGTILSYSLNPGSLGFCTNDYQCNEGSTCKDGTCSIHQCSKCVPYSTTELGNPDCLDYWDKPSNEQRLLDKTDHRFSAPISSHMCENAHPYFELKTPSGE